jgi:hypothetical protein
VNRNPRLGASAYTEERSRAMGKYAQVFALHYEADPDRVWTALQQAVDDMDGAKLDTVDEAARALEFETGVTLTSWGEYLQAVVQQGTQAGTQVQVRGKPKGTFLTTKWGEEIHGSTIERRLDRGIRAHLG